MEQETIFEFPNVFRLYTDTSNTIRVDRLTGTDTVPADTNSDTAVSTKDVTINPNVTARLFLPKRINQKVPVLVYFHGGAFVVGSACSPTYDGFMREVVERAGVVGVSVEYRMAPEHRLPVAYEDCWSAVEWVVGDDGEKDEWLEMYGDKGRVFLAGDSAGGNIAHHIAVRANNAGVAVERMALIHPYFWYSKTAKTHPDIASWMDGLWRAIIGPSNVSEEEWIDPTAEKALGKEMKKLMVCVAEKDWLFARGMEYAAAARQSEWDGEVEVTVTKGEEHCFHLTTPESEKASELINRIVAFFS